MIATGRGTRGACGVCLNSSVSTRSRPPDAADTRSNSARIQAPAPPIPSPLGAGSESVCRVLKLARTKIERWMRSAEISAIIFAISGSGGGGTAASIAAGAAAKRRTANRKRIRPSESSRRAKSNTSNLDTSGRNPALPSTLEHLKSMKPTFRPHRKKRVRRIGFRARMATRGGRKVLALRRLKGRKRLTVA